jgi:hypothetical protein
MDRFVAQWASRQMIRTLLVALVGLLLLFVLKDRIVQNDFSRLSFEVLVVVAGLLALAILSNWRLGVHLFLVWLVLEDLPRKYLGNNMVLYFGKDILAATVCVSFYIFISRKRTKEPLFRPPFLIPLLLFFWLGAIQVFNPNSPSVFYGLLGMKLYFYYVPLMFLGYALVRSEVDLHRFLVFNLGLAALVALLGMVQAVTGHGFLNPQQLAPELQVLGRLTRESPITHRALSAPTSVFVSAGRFSTYIIMSFIFGFGLATYQLVGRPSWRQAKLVLGGVGVIFAAALLSGTRGCIAWTSISAAVMMAAMLWGGPLAIRAQAGWIKAVWRSAIAVALVVVLVVALFPEAVTAHWSFYYETLDPSSPYFELGRRVGSYPLSNFRSALQFPDWPYGYGVGTASLGVQYLSMLLAAPPSPVPPLENGYATLLLEFGILGLVLWLIWTLAFIISGWRAVRSLAKTRLFPVGFSIWFFAFILLLPFTYGGIAPYQNFVLNAYLWLFVGILFRLPSLVAGNQLQGFGHTPSAPPHQRGV